MKVNIDNAWSHFKTRAEQRFTHWVREAEKNAETIKQERISCKFWQFKKKRDLEKKLLASYLEVNIVKGVILEIRLLK